MDNYNDGEMTPEDILEIIKKFNRFLTLNGRPCFSLKRQLERVPVVELRNLARDYRIIPKNLKKAELISRLAEVMTDEEVIKNVLIELPRDTRNFLLDVAKTKKGKCVSDSESPDTFYLALLRGLMGMYSENNHFVFVVTKEVREALSKAMADEAFSEKLYQYDTLETTLRACINLYGIVKPKDIIEIYQQYFPQNTLQSNVNDILSNFIAERDWVCEKGGYVCFPVFEETTDEVVDENYNIAKDCGRYYPSFNDFLGYYYFDYEEYSEGREAFFNLLKSITDDDNLIEKIISFAVTTFRTGGDSDVFDVVLMDEWMKYLGEDNYSVVSEEAETFGSYVHSWIFCGHSYNEILGISDKPSLSVIEGDKDSKTDTDFNQHPDDHKPKLRLL